MQFTETIQLPIQQIIPKTWGEEQIIINTPHYAAKLLIINPGYTSSIHHHQNKTETFIGIKGTPTLEITTETITYNKIITPQDQHTITPNTKHRFYNITETQAIILEISTHDDPNDSHRTTQSQKIQPIY